MPVEFTNIDFKIFRNRLLNYSRKWNISYEDKEEIVNDTLIIAMERFIEERGSFEAYCRLILKNLLINFTIANKHLYLLTTLDDNEEIVQADHSSIEDNESNSIATAFLQKLKGKLKNDEVKLFEYIYKSCDKLKSINISDASRAIDIEPSKGWDMFRKIQRKALTLYKELKDKDNEIYYLSYKKISAYREPSSRYAKDILSVHEEKLFIQLEKVDSITDGFEKFISGLNEVQLGKLQSIYGNTSE